MTLESPKRVSPMVAVVLLLAFVSPLAARDVSGLASATVSIKDRSPAERARASAVALSQVLIKLTGNRRTPGDVRAAALLGRASSLLLQYAYGAASDGGLTLNASFDQTVLSRELEARGIGTWSKHRPDTVVFLVVDDGQDRQLINSREPGTLGAAVQHKAAARALPVLLPRMDGGEATQLNAAQDSQALSDIAVSLAAPYGAAAVLVGHLRQTSAQGWEVHWRLDVDGETLQWKQAGALAEAVVEEGVDALGDALAERYAQPATLVTSEHVSLAVQGVNSAADYGRLANYLNSLDTISTLFLRSVDNQQVSYEITARGGRAALVQSLAFGRVLAPVPSRSDTYELLP